MENQLKDYTGRPLPAAFHPYLPDMDGITRTDDIAIKVEPDESGQWRVVILALYERGILSIILGLFAVYRFSVRQGRFSVVKDLHPSETEGQCDQQNTFQPPGNLFSAFTVSPDNNDEITSGTWQAFETVLRDLIKDAAAGNMSLVREKLIEDLSHQFSQIQNPRQTLLPITIRYDTHTSDSATVLHIISQETPGFLVALVNSLAMLNINIYGGRTDSMDDEVQIALWIVGSNREKIDDKAELKQLRVAIVLINQFTHLLPLSVDPALALRQFMQLVIHILNHPEWTQDFDSFKSMDVMATLAEIMGVSQFLWNDFLRMQHENLFPLIRNPKRLDYCPNRKEMVKNIEQELARAADVEEKVEILNQFKDREMFRIDLRHITRRISDIRFSRELTELADVIVSQVASLCYDQLVQRHGHPRLKNNAICDFSILAVGKFGGSEMGFASDIELLFVYEGSGATDGSETVSNPFFFELLVQLFLKYLKSKQDGIFEIDLRLRPFGEKGALVSSLDAFSEYYSTQGSAMQFEKMALVKLRPITGTERLQQKILAARDAFSYSGEPVDYSEIRRLRKLQIDTYIKKEETHAKYSRGGLVDLEYYIQACQIEHGRQLESVREANTIIALTRLQEAGIINDQTSSSIRSAYQCLRRVIDALRVVRGNAKDLNIPDVHSKTFHYLARRMRYDQSSELVADLKQSMDFGGSLWEMPLDKT